MSYLVSKLSSITLNKDHEITKKKPHNISNKNLNRPKKKKKDLGPK